MMDGYQMTAWGWVFMLGSVVAVLALLGVLVWVLAGQRPRPTTPLAQLDERLARGEIDVAEYERVRTALHADGQSA